MVSVNTGVDFLNGLRTCAEEVDGSSFYINEPITDFLDNCVVEENSKDMLRMEWKFSASIHRNYD